MQHFIARGAGRSLLSCVFAFAALPVGAEAPVPNAPLWTGIPNDAADIDIDPSRPGVELLSLAEACQVNGPDGDGLVTVGKLLKIKVYSADGSQVVMAPSKASLVTSGAFPDPRLARFQCGGANVTNYRAQFAGADADKMTNGHGVPVGPGHFNDACAPHAFEAVYALCDELPITTRGLVVARSGGNRVLLLGQAMNLQWHNNVANADVNASGFTVTAFAMDGSNLWSRSFPAEDAGYAIEGQLARVGDFLNDDGDDEIRVLSTGDGGVRYTYIDPLTGKNIGVVTAKPPKPPKF
jgi:hypothetical protein